jgi:diadenosine tetraphosphate (Ap4A) HIT family hydrolase
MNKRYNKMCPCKCFDKFEDDFFKEFNYWFLALNWEQGFLGRSLLILKAHKIDEMEMNDEEILEKHKIYCLWRKAITKAFNPDKINQAQLGNEEFMHKGHLHWHFVPRYRRPITFSGIEFQSDTPESQKLSYGLVHKRKVYPQEIRNKVKEELLKYLHE